MKKLILTTFALTGMILTKGALAEESNILSTCSALTKIIEICADNKASCQDKATNLAIALRQAKQPEDMVKLTVEMCSYYCLAPKEFNKDKFYKSCLNEFK